MACSDLVQRLLPAEPFHPSMLVRGRAVPDAWPGGLPPSLWRWEGGNISKEAYEAMRRQPVVKVGSLALLVQPPGGWRWLSWCRWPHIHGMPPVCLQSCSHCDPIRFWKIVNGRVYVPRVSSAGCWAVQAVASDSRQQRREHRRTVGRADMPAGRMPHLLTPACTPACTPAAAAVLAVPAAWRPGQGGAGDAAGGCLPV